MELSPDLLREDEEDQAPGQDLPPDMLKPGELLVLLVGHPDGESDLLPSPGGDEDFGLFHLAELRCGPVVPAEPGDEPPAPGGGEHSCHDQD